MLCFNVSEHARRRFSTLCRGPLKLSTNCNALNSSAFASSLASTLALCRFSTFVSSHWRADPAAIQSLIDNAGLSAKQTPTHYVIRECPLCQKPHKDKTDNLYKLHIQKASGCFFCHRCGSKGSFFDLKAALGQGPQVSSVATALPGRAAQSSVGVSSVRGLTTDASAAGLIDPAASITVSGAASARASSNAIAVDPAAALRASRALLDEDQFPAVLDYLTRVRGLSVETLRRYCVGALARDVPITASAAAVSAGAAAAAAGAGAPGASAGGVRPALFDGDFASLSPTGFDGMIAGGLGSNGTSAAVRWERHEFVVFPWMAVRQDALADLLAAQQAQVRVQQRGSGIGSGGAASGSLGRHRAHGRSGGAAAKAAGSSAAASAVPDLNLPSFGFGSDLEHDASSSLSAGSDAEAEASNAPASSSPSSSGSSPASSWQMPPESALLCNRFKLRSIRDKSVQLLAPRGGGWGMFGWHTLPPQLAGLGSASSSSSSGSSSAGGVSVHDLGVSVGYRRGGSGAGGGGRSSSGSSFTSYGSSSGSSPASPSSASVPTLVLTEGEFDAMSVWQDTGFAAVSLPNGARSMPLELLPRLEPFERILLWMDDDTPGREGAERIAEKLGLGRCQIVRPRPDLIIPRQPQPRAGAATAAAPGAQSAPDADAAADTAATGSSTSPSIASSSSSSISPKDANEFLQRGYDLRPLLDAATVRRHDQILSFGTDLRSAVLREVAASLGVRDGPYGGGSAGGRGRHSPSGVPFRSLPRLQRLLKGHRPGELTIVCGGTGSGKTTLLSQLSLDLAAQGVRTLWGSFEIKAARLISHMLAQLRSGRIPLPPDLAAVMAGHSPTGKAAGSLAAAGAASACDGSEADDDVVDVAVAAAAGAGAGGVVGDGSLDLPPGLGLDSLSSFPVIGSGAGSSTSPLFTGSPSSSSGSSGMGVAQRELAAYERAADALAALPMHFLRFYGATDVDRVLEALEYAYYAHDCEHVILDNLQFFLSSAGRTGFDRFDAQERALDRFRAFASRRNVHVTLVIHPRKEAEDAPLQMSSVFGTAKATQEADSVLILQKRPADGAKYIDIRKNRFDGATGIVPLAFDEAGRCFYEPDHVVQAPASPPHQHGGYGGGSGSGGNGSRWNGAQQQQQQQQRRPISTWARPASAGDATGAATLGFPVRSLHTSAGGSAAAKSLGSGSSSTRSGGGLSPNASAHAKIRYAMAIKAAQAARARLREQLAVEVEADLQRMYARLDAAAASAMTAASAGTGAAVDGPVGLPPLLTAEVAAIEPVRRAVVTPQAAAVSSSAAAAPPLA